jgi:outer membrane protein
MARVTGAALVVVLLAGLAAAPAAQRQAPPQGQGLKLAYINSQQILANTPGRAEAESTFNRDMAGFRAEVAGLQRQLDSAVAEYNRTSLVLSPSTKQTREQEIRQLEQRTRQRAADLEQQATQREQELTAPIMQRVNAVIEGVRAEFNYSMIFDASAPSGALVTADRTLDISPLVIQRLQAGAGQPQPGVAPAAGFRPSPAPPLPTQAADSGRQPPADSQRPRPRPRP